MKRFNFAFFLSLSICLLAISRLAAQSLVINELMASNAHTVRDPQGNYDDWIELYNTGASAVSLSGFSITDDIDTPAKWMLPDSVIPAGGYIIIWADDDSTDSPGIHLNFKITADGEYLGLYNGAAVIDSLTFPEQTEDVSYGRVDNGTGSFRYLVKPTPGSANYAPPVSDLESKIIINELMASNTKTITDPQGSFADWIELYNMSDSTISLLGTSITDDPLTPEKFVMPDVILEPDGYLIVWTDNDETDEGIHANFRLDAETGEFIGLYYTLGSQSHVLDSVTFGPQLPDTSYGRYPNGTGAFRFLYPASPGSSNKLENYSNRYKAIVINEFMADNDSVYHDAQNEYDDWIELYNTTDSTLSLSGMYMTDSPENTRKWKFPDVSIPAGGYLIVWADNDTLDDFYGVHTNFALSKGGEFIGIYDMDANGHGLIDSVYFGEQEENISYGRLTDGADAFAYFTDPTPGTSNNTSTDVTDRESLPREFILNQNYPNPFNQGTVISYQLPAGTRVSVIIYNILGQSVRRLFDGIQSEGSFQVRWDGRDDSGAVVASGVYIYRVQTESGFTAEKKMLLLK